MKKYIITCITVILCLFCVVFTASAETTADEQSFCSLGDVNGDNTVTSVDARLALRAAAKLQTLDEGPFDRADIKARDGAVTASDARHILRIAAKLETRPEHAIEVIAGKPATCTEDGISDGQVCSVCDKVFAEQVVIPAGHNEVVRPAVAATCTQSGLTEGSYCSVCNEDIIAQEEVAALGHTIKVNSEVPATCTAAGLTEGSECTVCKEVLVAQETIPAKGHNEIVILGRPATCTQSGVSDSKFCSDCGIIINVQTVIAATGHSMITVGEQAATCTSSGHDAYNQCENCGYVVSSSGNSFVSVYPATGHTEEAITEEVPATCTETGLTAGTKCSVCDEILVAQEEIPMIAHTEVLIPADPATCAKIGFTAGYKCSVCDTITLAPEEIPMKAHTVVTIPAVAATCTTGGLTEGSYCSACEISIVDQETTDPLGHVAEVIAGVAPTCTEAGLTEGSKCSVCDVILVAQEIADATGHKSKEIEAVAATCTETGLEGGTECEYCGVILSAQAIVPANGHTAGEVAIENDVAATCTVDGSYDEAVYCTVCDAELSRETTVVTAPGHTAGEVAIENDVAATCTVDGSYDEAVYCTVCDAEVSRETKVHTAPGHTPGEAVKENDVPATCTADGSYDMATYCTVCDAELSRETTEIAATGHTAGEAVKENDVPATCTADGSYDMATYCSVCNDELTRETTVVTATGHTEETIPAVEASFTVKGATEGTKCSVCDEILTAPEATPEKLVGMVNDANAWAAANGADALLGANTTGADLDVEIKIDGIWGDSEVADSAFDGLLTNFGAYLKDNFGDSAIVKIDGEEVYSNGKLHNTAMKNTIFNIGGGFFYNIANLAEDGVYGTYNIEITSIANGETVVENVAFRVIFTGNKLATIKEFAAVVAEHISMTVVDGDTVIDVIAPDALAAKLNDAYDYDTFNAATLGDILAEIAAYETGEIFASQATAMDKLASTILGFDGVINKIVGKVVSATIVIDGEEVDLLNGTEFGTKADVADFGALVEAVTDMINSDDVLAAEMGAFLVEDGVYQFAVTVSVDMSNVDGMDNNIITETIIFNVHIPVVETTTEKLEDVANDTNKWSEANLGGLVAAEVAGTDLIVAIDVDAIWDDSAINNSAFDGLLTNLGNYLDENLGLDSLVIDGEEVYSDGNIHNTAVKNTLFNVGGGFFYNIANLADDGVYGTYAVVADGEEFTLVIKFTGNKLATVKEFAAVVADHISMTVVDGDTVIDVIAPDALAAKLNETYDYDTFNAATLGDILAEIAAYETGEIFASQATAMDKLASTILGFDGVINKIVGKVVSATIVIDGEEVDLLNGTEFGTKADVADFGALVEAVTDMINSDDVLAAEMGAFLVEEGVYQFAVTVSVDMSNIDAMDNNIITETIIFNVHIPVVETTTEKLEDVANDTNKWSEANLGGLVAAEVAGTDLIVAIDVDAIWNDSAINDSAFDGLLTNLGAYLDEELGLGYVTIDGEEVYSDGRLHNTAVKNTLFNVGGGFFYNIANLADDGVYGTYTVVADGEEFTLVVKFTGNKLATVKAFAAVVAEHISMTVVDGDTVVTIQMPEAYMNNTNGGMTDEELVEFLPFVTIEDFINELAAQGAEGTFGSEVSAITKICSMLCGHESVVNKILGKVVSMTVLVDGEEISVLKEDAVFEVKESGDSFSDLMTSICDMLSDDFKTLALGDILDGETLVLPITVTVDMGNLDAMDNNTITETIIINLNLF